jgi:hypothetical protein
MSDKIDNLKKIRLDFEDNVEKLTGKEREFPKYTTQLINIANQNAQGTRPKVVGQISELIKKCPNKTYIGWKTWYMEKFPKAIDNATDKIIDMVEKMKKAMGTIDREMVKEWVEDLVIDKTAEGLIIQEIVLKTIAEQKGVEYRGATPEEESQNIDGYVGTQPVQIKSESYLSKKSSVREEISVPVIYYKKTDKYLYIYYGKKKEYSKMDKYLNS